jgi:Mce-associated membrane protein
MPPDQHSPASGTERPHRVVVISMAVLAALALLAGVAASSFQISHHNRTPGAANPRAAALNTGRKVVLAFTTLDYRQLTQDFQRLAALATPSFKQAYLTQTNQAAERIVKAKATAQGNVVAIAVSTLDGNTATVLAAVNEAVKNTSQPKGQEKYFRLDVSLQKQKNGGWLASAVTPV